jgi:hypothetical protein
MVDGVDWIGTGGCSREHGNEPSGSTKGGKSIEYLNDCQLLKKDSAPKSQLTVPSYRMLMTA